MKSMFSMGKRVFLFMAVNLLVIVTISITLQLVGHFMGVRPDMGTMSGLALLCLVWGMGGAFISLALSRMMAKWMLGVRVISPEDRGELGELVLTVDRLAQAAGLPRTPEVGIYDSPELNAFATGPTRSRALVAVSTGLLRNLRREELEGVLGHELSHVANGDMVTMTLVQGVVNAFVMFLSRVIAFAVSQSVKENARNLVRFLVTIALEIALSMLGMIVVAWFSRRREFKADRGGAQLAGRGAMIGALKALQAGVGRVGVEEHASLATLKISGRPRGFVGLFASHPDIELRIRALEEIPS